MGIPCSSPRVFHARRSASIAAASSSDLLLMTLIAFRRTVTDIAVVLDVIVGYDDTDPQTAQA